MESVWATLRNSLDCDDQTFFAVSTSVTHSGVFFILNGMLWVFHRKNWFQSFRIQKTEYPSDELLRDCIKDVILNHLLIVPILSYLAYPYARSHFGAFSMTTPLPSASTIARDLLVCIACEDTLFYWCHRALHHRLIYKYVHKKHHKFKSNVGIASEYAHPVESVVSNFIPFMLGPTLLGSHCMTFSLWALIRVTESINAHSGFDFPWVPYNWFDNWQGGAIRHDFHHSHNVGSYGSFTKFWDWLMGTDAKLWQHLAKEKANEAKRD